MEHATHLASTDAESLRLAHYNAEVTWLREVHDELRILRVRPDSGRLAFEPGQYTVLGLGSWEPRVEGAQEEPPAEEPRLIRRPYSISSRILDPDGSIACWRDDEELEFYITLVRWAARPPALTPRLFLLRPGSRLHVGPRPHGRFTLSSVGPQDRVAFLSTGTGEAPHNAMLAALLLEGHPASIVHVTCVRRLRDLAYEETHRRLERSFPRYRRMSLTTREPWNLDPGHPEYVGKQYLQDYFASDRLEQACGWRLDPEDTHVFLCGSPEMIGAPWHVHDWPRHYPSPRGMVELLEGRGFRVDCPNAPGNIHYETYW